MKSRFLGFCTITVAWVIPTLTSAQDTNPEAISQLARLIRWSGVVTSLFLVLAVWFGLRISKNFFERMSKQFPARRLFLQKVATILQFVVYVMTASAVIVLSVRVDQTVLALIGGTLAVSIGFAIRDVVASFIAGIMIMVDRPFQVGDRVSFGGEYGDITAIGLRSVRMQTLDDNTVTIPNNKFITDITSCGNYGALDMQIVMDFYIGVDQDIGEARNVATEAALTSRYIHLPKPVVVLVNQVIQGNYVAVRLRLKAYVLDTRYEKAFETDVNLRVMKTFCERGIHPPAILHRMTAIDIQPSLMALATPPEKTQSN
ncbi:MAG: mechanosensitive ion channel domain-containing protein [Myxococcota bacterium]